MAERERGVERRALVFTLVFPVVLAAVFVGSGLLISTDVHGGLILPLGGNPVPIGVFFAVAALCIIVTGAAVSSQAARTSLPRQGRRVLMGAGMTLQLAVTSLFGAALMGQVDPASGGPPPDPAHPLDLSVLAAGCGAALALGVVLGMTYKPEDQWSAADDEALAQVLAEERDPLLSADRLTYWIHPRSSVILMILLLGVFPGALLTLLSPWFLPALALAAVVAIGWLSALVQVDRTQLSVSVAGVVPAIVLPCSAVEAAVPLSVVARDHGGWGLHKHGGSATFLSSSGAAVVLRSTEEERIVVGAPTADSAETLAAILNRRAGKAASD